MAYLELIVIQIIALLATGATFALCRYFLSQAKANVLRGFRLITAARAGAISEARNIASESNSNA